MSLRTFCEFSKLTCLSKALSDFSLISPPRALSLALFSSLSLLPSPEQCLGSAPAAGHISGGFLCCFDP